MVKILSALFLLTLAPFVAAPATAQGYTFTMIDFPGAGNTRTLGLNDSNESVGGYGMAGQQHGYILSGGVFQTVEPPGSAFARARSINNAHIIVGWYQQTPDDVSHGFAFDGTTYFTLDHPDGVGGTYVYGINDLNQIVGGYVDADGNEHGVAVLEDGGMPVPIDCPGATNTQPFMINNVGQIVGACDTGRPDGSIGFIYDVSTSTFTFYDFPGAVNTAFFGINDNGLLVGSYDDNTLVTHGFTYDGTTSNTLDFPGAPNSAVRAVNSTGSVVGIYYQADGSNIRGFKADLSGAAPARQDHNR